MDKSFEEWKHAVEKRVELFNASSFATAVTDCAVCLGKGLHAYVRHTVGNVSLAIEDCDCKRLISQADKLRLCGMPELVQRCGFDNYRIAAPWQAELCKTVRACADTEKWLLLCGQSGSGKTHLAAALCRELLCRGKSVLCVSWPETVRRLIAAGFERESLLQPLLNAQVLFVDDLFKSGADQTRGVSRQELDIAFTVVEHRSRLDKRTLITTELLSRELERLSEGLFGRISQCCGSFICNIARARERNHRLKTA